MTLSSYQKIKKWASDHMRQTPVDAAEKEIRRPHKQRQQDLSNVKKGIQKRAESAKGTAKLARFFGYTFVAAGVATGAGMVAIYAPGAVAAGKDAMIEGAAWLAANHPLLAKVLIGTPGAAVGAKKAARGAARVTPAMQRMLGAMSKGNLKHSTKHLAEFMKLDPKMTAQSLRELGARVATTEGNLISKSGAARQVFEQVVDIGGNPTTVRSVLNEAGRLHSIHIRY